MAARKIHGAKAVLGGPSLWRQRIETTKLLNRLQGFAKGELNLDSGQVKAIDILLRKVLPDLTENKTEHSGSVTVVRRSFSRNPNT